MTVGVLPFSGGPDDVFYFNALVQRLAQDPALESVETDYVRRVAGERPDLILSISPHASYRSSGWNFLINWPGFLLFTPAWNGYVYHADVMTDFAIHDGDGQLLSSAQVPVAYDIRQTDGDRGAVAGFSWLEVSLMAFIGGIYNAQNFDRDIIGTLQNTVRNNYATFVHNDLQSKLRSASRAVIARRRAEEALPEIGAGSPVDEQEGPSAGVDGR